MNTKHADEQPDAGHTKNLRGTVGRLNADVRFGYVLVDGRREAYIFLLGKAIKYRNACDMKVGDRVEFHVDPEGRVDWLVIIDVPADPLSKELFREYIAGRSGHGWFSSIYEQLWKIMFKWDRHLPR